MQETHRRLSVQCFNDCWDLIDKAERDDAETESMRLLAYASLWHWKQRDDCAPMNLSVGYWQVSRVEALAGNGDLAGEFGRKSLDAAQTGALPPFYAGYAYEALARAELVRGDLQSAMARLAAARAELAKVTDAESAQMLEADLNAVQALVP
ncbi:MAG: hypothetical protein FJX72_11480 [Armatimonadetes bacterium]|nr:hypothetical protein [Armatimonadota bacterium]